MSEKPELKGQVDVANLKNEMLAALGFLQIFVSYLPLPHILLGLKVMGQIIQGTTAVDDAVKTLQDHGLIGEEEHAPKLMLRQCCGEDLWPVADAVNLQMESVVSLLQYMKACGCDPCPPPENTPQNTPAEPKKASPGTGNVVELTEETFAEKVFTGKNPALVVFTAGWCPACRAYKPVLEAVAKHYGSRVLVGTVNNDTEHHLASEYGVTAVPYSCVFLPNRGNKPVSCFPGAKDEREVIRTIEGLLRKKN